MEWKNIWSTRKSDFDVCELILIGFQRKWWVLNGKHLYHTQSFPSLKKKAVVDKNYSHPSWFFSQVTMLLLIAFNKSDLLSTAIRVIPTSCLKLNFILSSFSNEWKSHEKFSRREKWTKPKYDKEKYYKIWSINKRLLNKFSLKGIKRKKFMTPAWL